MSDFDGLLKDIKKSTESDFWQGNMKQIDARLVSDNRPVRILQDDQGYRVSVGRIPATPPPAVSGREAGEILKRESGVVEKGRK